MKKDLRKLILLLAIVILTSEVYCLQWPLLFGH